MISTVSCTHESHGNSCHNIICSWHLLLIRRGQLNIPPWMFNVRNTHFQRQETAKCQSLLHFLFCVCVFVLSFPTGCLSACGCDRLEGDGIHTGETWKKKKDNVRSFKYSENKLIQFIWVSCLLNVNRLWISLQHERNWMNCDVVTGDLFVR